MAARFGDMLLEQRRRMGLSIQQVANTIKIRPQIIEFFETGNFASMPPRGYAQGMISSYARFLGLNPREVVNAYFDDLMAYERETSQQGGRFQDAAGYVNSRSSVDNGRFLMVQGGRSTRYGQRPPQAGYITETAPARRFVLSEIAFAVRPCRMIVRFPPLAVESRSPRRLRRRWLLRSWLSRSFCRAFPRWICRRRYHAGDAALRSQSQPYGQRSSAPRSGQRGYQNRGELAPRSGQRGSQSQGGYRGRPDSGRGRMPQVNGRGGSNRGRGGGRAPQNNGLDPRIIYAGIGAVALLLILLIVVLLRGCGSSAPESTPETPRPPRRRPRSLPRRPNLLTRMKAPTRRRILPIPMPPRRMRKRKRTRSSRSRSPLPRARPPGSRSRSTVNRSSAPRQPVPLSRSTRPSPRSRSPRPSPPMLRLPRTVKRFATTPRHRVWRA